MALNLALLCKLSILVICAVRKLGIRNREEELLGLLNILELLFEKKNVTEKRVRLFQNRGGLGAAEKDIRNGGSVRCEIGAEI